MNGKSIMGVMMLAAEHGSTILLRADGPDADAGARRARDARQQQVRRALSGSKAASAFPRRPASPSARCTSCAGRCRRSGIASSPMTRSRRRSSAFTTRSSARRSACARFASASSSTAGPQEAAIFDVQRSILDDQELITDVEELIRQNLGAEKAFEIVMFEWRQRFARARASDAARARRRSEGRRDSRAHAAARPARSRSRRPAEGRERDSRHARPDAEPHGAARSRGDRRRSRPTPARARRTSRSSRDRSACRRSSDCAPRRRS